MTEFVIAMHGDNDYRLVKYDGSSETEIGTGWDHRPAFEECLNALADHHSVGNTPFASREGMVDSHILTKAWGSNIPTRDMTLDDETMPWNDS